MADDTASSPDLSAFGEAFDGCKRLMIAERFDEAAGQYTRFHCFLQHRVLEHGLSTTAQSAPAVLMCDSNGCETSTANPGTAKLPSHAHPDSAGECDR